MTGHADSICSDARKLAHEIQSDVMAGEDEIAAAIQRGFNYHAKASERRASACLDWAIGTFGEVVATHPPERAMRFVEEAIELAHAGYVRREVLHQMVDRVCDRPAGDINREMGQSQLTLELLARLYGVDLDAEATKEFQRIQDIPKAEWSRRHGAKVALGIAT